MDFEVGILVSNFVLRSVFVRGRIIICGSKTQSGLKDFGFDVQALSAYFYSRWFSASRVDTSDIFVTVPTEIFRRSRGSHHQRLHHLFYYNPRPPTHFLEPVVSHADVCISFSVPSTRTELKTRNYGDVRKGFVVIEDKKLWWAQPNVAEARQALNFATSITPSHAALQHVCHCKFFLGERTKWPLLWPMACVRPHVTLVSRGL